MRAAIAAYAWLVGVVGMLTAGAFALTGADQAGAVVLVVSLSVLAVSDLLAPSHLDS